jgi:hypothetical protein
MKSWGNRKTLYRDVAGALAKAKAGDQPAPVLTDGLVSWLAQLTLLYGVPVEYLVADSRLLPIESMRYFFIDRNWLDRLVDGALSVGALSTREKVFNEAFYEQIYAQIDGRQMVVRDELRNDKTYKGGSPTVGGGAITGLLFRSCVVSGWPGLEVEALINDVPIKILRMDRLSDNLMFCLFDGLPDKVRFTEPGEGLHFGIVRESQATDFKVYLRGLGFPDASTYPPGEQIKIAGQPVTAPGHLLTGPDQEPGVVDISGLVNSITASMPPGALQNGILTPGGMAIQLVLGAGRQTYDLNSPECTNQR